MENLPLANVMTKGLAIASSTLMAGVIFLELNGVPSFGFWKRTGEPCQEMVQAKTLISKQQLAQLLTLPVGTPQAKIREVLNQPYCKLANLQIRTGATAVREAYPLDFDSQNWLIVLSEGDQYAGYRISPR